MKKNFLLAAVLAMSMPYSAFAQSELYPGHFDLEEVSLFDSPLKTAMEINDELLLKYDIYRLLTPYVRQSGLGATTDSSSDYYQWESKHPSFDNWGNNSFNLDGHVGGHYLSALALAYAATHDATLKAQFKAKLDYMVSVMKDCQDAYDSNTTGLYGFIGGQPINAAWTDLYAGNPNTFYRYGGWVPFYCEHKILAGLRDAYVYGDNETARSVFKKLCDWCINVVSNISDDVLQNVLNTEHGGVNESLMDAYTLFGESKYLTAAKRYSHNTMVNGMQGSEGAYSTTFLDGKHANTQVPKYIGFERIAEEDATATTYGVASRNFWDDVADHRTVCIGGNSVSEHFLAANSSNRYIDILDGPESCNSNNMLKLSEMMSDKTHNAKYADFYEYTMYNHILSTQDPNTGGYVYFTTLRPQGYRIYSQVNQAMWCCVGTGMENHSKYGHFIYTRDGNSTVYVNLFTASKLENEDFVLTQSTSYPFEQKSTITVGKAGTYTIAIRHPWWTTGDYSITVNGSEQNISVTQGTASYVSLNRTWNAGDVIVVNLPMALRYAECPNYTDYIAFEYGPILLGAQTTASSADEASATGLEYETLQNEYGGEGRMDHAPGSMATSKSLTKAPLLIGDRSDVLSRINATDLSQLKFTIDASRENVASYTWGELELKPFYSIHHARYMCYWYQQTAENFANSSMAATEAINEALAARTIDFVAPGEQQSEAGHEYAYSTGSTSGYYNTEKYRDAEKGTGYIQYTLYNQEGYADSLSILCRFQTADAGRKGTLYVDGTSIADIVVSGSHPQVDSNGFYNIEFPIPANLVKDASGNVKTSFVVRLEASSTTMCPGLYYLRLMNGCTLEKYSFRAADWSSGDTGRISVSDISYDETNNVINLKKTGSNNLCLSIDYANRDYYIATDKTYFIIRGTGLSTADGASYLWWLNGANHATSVAPTSVTTTTINGEEQTIIAWDMTSSGLFDNFVGSRYDVCLGQTIFGLTSSNSDGSAAIYDINFASSVSDYLGIVAVTTYAGDERPVIDAVDAGDNGESEESHNFTTNGTNVLNSTYGTYSDETWRNALGGKYVTYDLNTNGKTEGVSLVIRWYGNDGGRDCSLSIDGVVIDNVYINSMGTGFCNLEYPIDAKLLEGKTSVTLKIESVNNMYTPGFYYIYLCDGYEAVSQTKTPYEWVNTNFERNENVTVSYNSADNSMKVVGTSNAESNLNLRMKTSVSGTYSLRPDQYLLTMVGTGLTATANLWWLNGYNQGSQDKPTYTLIQDGVTYLVWDIRKTPYAANMNFWGNDEVVISTSNSGAYSLACFGLQSSAADYSATLTDINFYSPDELTDAYPALKELVPSMALALSAESMFAYDGFVYQVNSTNESAYVITELSEKAIDEAPETVLGYQVKTSYDNLILDETDATLPAVTSDKFNVTLNRSINFGEWTSLCVPFNMDIPEDWHVKEPVSSVLDGSNLIVIYDSASSIEAGKPYLVEVEENVTSLTVDSVVVNTSVVPFADENVTIVGTMTSVVVPNGSFYIRDCRLIQRI